MNHLIIVVVLFAGICFSGMCANVVSRPTSLPQKDRRVSQTRIPSRPEPPVRRPSLPQKDRRVQTRIQSGPEPQVPRPVMRPTQKPYPKLTVRPSYWSRPTYRPISYTRPELNVRRKPSDRYYVTVSTRDRYTSRPYITRRYDYIMPRPTEKLYLRPETRKPYYVKKPAVVPVTRGYLASRISNERPTVRPVSYHPPADKLCFRKPDGKYADWTDKCRSWYSCSRGIATRFKCPPGELFSDVADRCMQSIYVKCRPL